MRLQYAKAPLPAGQAGQGKSFDMDEELVALIIDRSFFIDKPALREASAFNARLAAGKGQIMDNANEVCKLAADILAVYQRIRKHLDKVTQINWLPSLQDMRVQLDHLVYRGFLSELPFDHLRHYPRYLKALEIRLERLPSTAPRDRQLINDMSTLYQQWQERMARARELGRIDPRLDELRWMFEELRVSLFAQPQPTAYPISLKRIAKRWSELGL
jgi:ATP-dependent helicase HrpA